MSEPAWDIPAADDAQALVESDRSEIGVGTGGACPSCRSPLDVGQAYCLECGQPANRFPRKQQPRRRTVSGPVVPLQQPRKFPWIPLTIIVLLVVGGVTYALMASDADKSSDTAEPTEAARIADDLTSTPDTDDESSLEPEPAFPEAADEPTTDDPFADEEDPFAGDDEDAAFPDGAASDGPDVDDGSNAGTWPAGKSGWTVVLASYAKDTYPKSTADQRAVEGQAQGLETGVIDSDGFASMSTGYWVVYAGVFSSRSEAEQEEARIKDLGNVGVYTKEVK